MLPQWMHCALLYNFAVPPELCKNEQHQCTAADMLGVMSILE